MYHWIARDKASEWKVIERFALNGPLPFSLGVEAVCEPLIPDRDGKRISPDELIFRLAGRLASVARSGYVSCDLDNLMHMLSERDVALLAAALQRLLSASRHTVIPAVRTSTPPLLLAAMIQWGRIAGVGLSIRIEGVTAIDDKAAAADEIIRAAKLGSAQIDLVTDTKNVPSHVSIADLAAHLPISATARRWVFVGGSFPSSVTDLSPEDYLHVLDRREWSAYAGQIYKTEGIRLPDFGDYATQPSQYEPSKPFQPSPTVRYTTANAFVVLRGRKNAPEGFAQFIGHARYLRGQPYFTSVVRSVADDYVERIATGAARTGHGGTWRVMSLGRHVDVAVSQVGVVESRVGPAARAARR